MNLPLLSLRCYTEEAAAEVDYGLPLYIRADLESHFEASLVESFKVRAVQVDIRLTLG